jgi:alanine dehydrogenase
VTVDRLRTGQHLNLLGADGPGKAEATIDAIEHVKTNGRLFCDEWQQATHGGELTGAVAAGLIERTDVTELGTVCAGLAEGRGGSDQITAFDSTGLAIQDLAIALGAMEALDAGVVKPQTISL